MSEVKEIKLYVGTYGQGGIPIVEIEHLYEFTEPQTRMLPIIESGKPIQEFIERFRDLLSEETRGSFHHSDICIGNETDMMRLMDRF